MSDTNHFDDIDQELLDIFLEEAQDLMEECDGILIRLRENPHSMEGIVGLQRALHTIKGGARMTGMTGAGNLSHGIESFIGAIVARRITLDEPRMNLLGEGIDELRHMMEVAKRGEVPNTAQSLVDTFEHQASLREVGTEKSSAPSVQQGKGNEGGSLEQNQEIQQVRATQEEAQHSDPVNEQNGINALMSEFFNGLSQEDAHAQGDEGVEVDESKPDSEDISIPEGEQPAQIQVSTDKRGAFVPGPMPDPPVENSVPKRPVRSGEQVRIQAEFLDLLVSRSNEMAIYRSRLEQQLSSLRVVVAELGRTNMRMRDQLRRLDGETEAQIVARYQRERSDGDASFDPLELDRFSSLQQLTRALAESSDDFSGLHETLENLSRQYDQLMAQQSMVGSELQEGLLRARLLPFDKMAPRLARIVRQAASDQGKRVRLDLDGAHGDLDRNILDKITSPLEHMIRNSIAHGIERPDVRAENGKQEEGIISLSMRNEGAEIIIEVSDDGAGLDRKAIRKRAIERGLIKDEDELSQRALDDLIFSSGFSTSNNIDQLSGRGVGMDVVRSEVRQLGGSVEINSIEGQGTRFTLRIPQKMAVTQAVHVKSGDAIFAIPASSIVGIGKYEGQPHIYPYAGVDYTVVSLRQLTQSPRHASSPAGEEDHSALLLVRSGDLNVAVMVDQVLGSREIVVKQVGTHIAEVPGIYGATIDETGQVVIILELSPMVRQFMSRPVRDQETEEQVEDKTPTILVVDDSITMRKVTGRVLERHKFEVKTARDGIDALDVMENCVPDLMLLDIEMPRMDGYELASRMRADERYKHIPIIMITSRTGEKHRQKAMHIGVQKYLGKPYQEAELLRHIRDILDIPAVLDEDGGG